MKRRGFLKALGAVAAAPVALTAVKPTKPTVTVQNNSAHPIYVGRADGNRYIVGVAVETVRAGDLVQIQTTGPATVRFAKI